MNMKQALNLKNGDTVISKTTGERIKVEEIEIVLFDYGTKAVLVKGIGEKQGRNTWHHRTILFFV